MGDARFIATNLKFSILLPRRILAASLDVRTERKGTSRRLAHPNGTTFWQVPVGSP